MSTTDFARPASSRPANVADLESGKRRGPGALHFINVGISDGNGNVEALGKGGDGRLFLRDDSPAQVRISQWLASYSEDPVKYAQAEEHIAKNLLVVNIRSAEKKSITAESIELPQF